MTLMIIISYSLDFLAEFAWISYLLATPVRRHICIETTDIVVVTISINYAIAIMFIVKNILVFKKVQIIRYKFYKFLFYNLVFMRIIIIMMIISLIEIDLFIINIIIIMTVAIFILEQEFLIKK